MFKWNWVFCVYLFFSVWLRVALETLDRLTESLDFTDYASRIIHPIVRTLDSTPELRSTSMDTLSSLVFQLGKKVAVAVPKALFKCSFYSVDYFQPSCCWLHMNSISVTPTPQSLLLPARLLMSFTFWRRGVVFMRLDEVTFTSPSPSELFPPLSLNPPIVFRPDHKPKCSHVWQQMWRGTFDLRLIVVRYKCRILSYLAYGEGKEVARLDHIIKHTYTLLFTLLPFPLICSTRYSSPWWIKWCWSTGSTTSVMTYLYVALLR